MRSAKLLLAPIMLAIAVQVTFAKKHDDSPAQITARVEDKLYHAQVYKHGDVEVSVDNGIATLTGTVDCLGVKMDAEHAARKSRPWPTKASPSGAKDILTSRKSSWLPAIRGFTVFRFGFYLSKFDEALQRYMKGRESISVAAEVEASFHQRIS